MTTQFPHVFLRKKDALKQPMAPVNGKDEVFISTTVSDLIRDAKANPLKWIVPGVVIEDGVHVLHGAEESFKTTLTLQLHEVLSAGGCFLGRRVEGGVRTGFVQLEMKPRQFGHRLNEFFRDDVPRIHVLSDATRREVLMATTPKARIKIIADWVDAEALEFVSIDSAAKLFPAGFNSNEQNQASEVFSQIQRLPAVCILAHDRKPMPGVTAKIGNSEIVGSGRFAQDPDIVHQMIRKDARAPEVEFHCGKMRHGEKFDPVTLFFDRIEYRLFPVHPYLHLIERQAMLGTELIAEAERRYGWKERWAREHLKTLTQLVDADGNLCVTETMRGHSKLYQLLAQPTVLLGPGDLVQGCSKSQGLIEGASLLPEQFR